MFYIYVYIYIYIYIYIYNNVSDSQLMFWFLSKLITNFIQPCQLAVLAWESFNSSIQLSERGSYWPLSVDPIYNVYNYMNSIVISSVI